MTLNVIFYIFPGYLLSRGIIWITIPEELHHLHRIQVNTVFYTVVATTRQTHKNHEVTWKCFVKFVCQGERIGTLNGWMPAAPPGFADAPAWCIIMTIQIDQFLLFYFF